MLKTAAAILLLSVQPLSAIESGVASMYWPGSYRWGGSKASNGERINFKAMTVAHPKAAWGGTMPFGTCLVIRYARYETKAIVNDNGPHVKGRVLDFTPAVAKALHFPGLGRVKFWKCATASM